MNDPLGDRMKKYESVSNHKLTQKVPVILRVDGKAFHTFTKNATKPFDINLIESMVRSAEEVAKEMMGFVLAYHQSDEVTFYINNNQKLESEAWFDNKISKLVSITASLFTSKFNYIYGSNNAVFDCRAFNVPYTEVPNVFIWRQRDWERNSVHMYARSIFSHNDLMNKNKSEIHEMLYERGLNWNNLHPQLKNGTFITLMNERLWGKYNYDQLEALIREIELVKED